MIGDGKTHMFLAGRRIDIAPDQLKENLTRSHGQLVEMANFARLGGGNLGEVDEKLNSIPTLLNAGSESLANGDIEHAELVWGFALVTLGECKEELDRRLA